MQDAPSHTPRDPQLEQRVRASFERQALMATFGATLVRVVPGEVVIDLPFRSGLSPQHVTVVAGELHADEEPAPVAILTGTMRAVRDRPGLADERSPWDASPRTGAA